MMKQKIRIPAMILALILAASLLTACSGSAKPTETQTEKETEESKETQATSEAVSTAELTTAVPTTEAPTTAVPTTAEPTTEAPTTEAPTTEETAETLPEGLKEYEFEGVICLVPENFVEKEGSDPLTLIASGATEGNNLTFVAANDQFEYYTKDSLEKMIRNAYQTAYNADVKDFTYECKTIQGRNLVIAHFTANLTQYGLVMKQTSCTVFLQGRSVTITYTAVDDEFDALSRACAEHIYISGDSPAADTTAAADDITAGGFKDYRYEGVIISIPEDFVESEGSTAAQVTLVHKSKKTETLSETITLQTTAGTIDDFNAPELRKQFEQMYQQSLGAELTDWTYVSSKIEGGNRVNFGFAFESSGVHVRQNYSIAIFKNKAVVVLTTEVNGMFEEAFRTVLESVRIDTSVH